MKTVGTILAELAKKAGIPPGDPALKALTELQQPVTQEIEDNLFSLMNTGEAENWAKGNTSVKDHYIAIIFKAWDKKLLESAESFGFTDEEKNALNNERKTGRKHELFDEMLKSRLEAAKEGMKQGKKNDDPGEVEKHKKEFERVSKLYEETKSTYEKQLSEKDTQFANYKKNSKIAQILGEQKWSDNIPAEMRNDVGLIAINKGLEKMGAVMHSDDSGEIILKQRENPDMNYFDATNKNPKFTEFVAKTLSENKMLAVSTATPTQKTTVPPPPIGQAASNTPKKSNSIVSGLINSGLETAKKNGLM